MPRPCVLATAEDGSAGRGRDPVTTRVPGRPAPVGRDGPRRLDGSGHRRPSPERGPPLELPGAEGACLGWRACLLRAPRWRCGARRGSPARPPPTTSSTRSRRGRRPTTSWPRTPASRPGRTSRPRTGPAPGSRRCSCCCGAGRPVPTSTPASCSPSPGTSAACRDRTRCGPGRWRSASARCSRGPGLAVVPSAVADGVLRWTTHVVTDVPAAGAPEPRRRRARPADRRPRRRHDARGDGRRAAAGGVREEIAASLRARPQPTWPAGTPGRPLRVLQHADEVEAILGRRLRGRPRRRTHLGHRTRPDRRAAPAGDRRPGRSRRGRRRDRPGADLGLSCPSAPSPRGDERAVGHLVGDERAVRRGAGSPYRASRLRQVDAGRRRAGGSQQPGAHRAPLQPTPPRGPEPRVRGDAAVHLLGDQLDDHADEPGVGAGARRPRQVHPERLRPALRARCRGRRRLRCGRRRSRSGSRRHR